MTAETIWGQQHVVDLTLLLAEELPCTWPGHMPYQQKTFNYFSDVADVESPLRSHCGHYQTRWLLIDEHTGTHVDAPAHFVPRIDSGLDGAHEIGAVTAEQIPLSQLIGPAVVVDVSALRDEELAPGVSPFIEISHLTVFEEAHGEFSPGDIVLFKSNWDRDFYREGPDGARYAQNAVIHSSGKAWPAPSAAAMEYLADKGIRCVGTDGPSMGAAHDGGPVHVMGLGSGLVFLEGLAHLASLPVRGAVFVFAPLKVARGSGAPGRAFAFVNGDSRAR